MLTFEQEVELGTTLNIWSLAPSMLKTVDLTPKGFAAAYIYEPTKGGKQIIVGPDGKYLAFSSSISLSKVLEDIKYNNLWTRAVDINNK